MFHVKLFHIDAYPELRLEDCNKQDEKGEKRKEKSEKKPSAGDFLRFDCKRPEKSPVRNRLPRSRIPCNIATIPPSRVGSPQAVQHPANPCRTRIWGKKYLREQH